MDYSKLVDEVLEELNKRILLNYNHSNKKKVLLINGLSKQNNNMTDYEFITASELITYGDSTTANTPITDGEHKTANERKTANEHKIANELITACEAYKQYDLVLIETMPIPMMVNLALGNYMSLEEKLIIEALLCSKPVYLLDSGLEYRRFKQTTYNALFAQYEEYEKRLLQLGIRKVTHLGEIGVERGEIDKYNRQLDAVNTNKFTTIDLSYKKLLLESDLLKLHTKGKVAVKIDKSCIVTPLAGDFIKSHDINLLTK